MALVLGAVACGDSEAPPRAQWVVKVTTNAPPPPFFDRVLVEILDDTGALACGGGCRRSFAITSDTAWPIELGVTASSAPTHVRARIHRSDHVDAAGLPLAPMLIDVMGRLPEANGITPVELAAPMECFGVGSDPAGHAACDPSLHVLGDEPRLGPPSATPLVPGSWGPAQQVECRGDLPPGMVCIPGGAFFFGKVVAAASSLIRTTPEHLVKLSPFFLDVDEITVGAVRQLIRGTELEVGPRVPVVDPKHPDSACVWRGVGSAENDAMPMNCVRWGFARRVCEMLGKRMPTEAEFEWAAGNTTLETDYPWGGDPDACSNARVAHGRTLDTETTAVEALSCRKRQTPLAPWGPVAGGHPKDVTLLGVRNLGGNLSEWAGDRFYAEYTDPCWGDPSTLVENPRCDLEAPRLLTAAPSRGGSWSDLELFSRTVARLPKVSTDQHQEWAPNVGFRCARDSL